MCVCFLGSVFQHAHGPITTVLQCKHVLHACCAQLLIRVITPLDVSTL